MHTTTPKPLTELNYKINYFKQLESVINLRLNWICIDDVLGTSLLCSSTDSTSPLCWNIQIFFTSAQTSDIFSNLFPSKNPMFVPLASFNIKIYLILYSHILEINFIPHSNGSAFKWMNSLTEILAMDTQNDWRHLNCQRMDLWSIIRHFSPWKMKTVSADNNKWTLDLSYPGLQS